MHSALWTRWLWLCSWTLALGAAVGRQPGATAATFGTQGSAGPGGAAQPFTEADPALAGKSIRPDEAPLFPVNVTFDPWAMSSWGGATIRMDPYSRELRVDPGVSPLSAVAWARLADDVSKTGWMELVVETVENPRVSNSMKMYGAGFVEGILTAVRTSQFYSNFWQTLARDAQGEAALQNIQQRMYAELEYVKKKTKLRDGLAAGEPVDDYWKQVRYVFLQLWGLRDGYNAIARQKQFRKLELIDVMLINSHAELPELMQAYMPEAVKQRHKFHAVAAMQAKAGFLQKGSRGHTAGLHAADGGLASAAASNPEHNASAEERAAADRDWERRLARKGHCSALVRVAPEQKDLFAGHTTWSDYGKMTRIFKYYHFKLPGAGTAATHMGFSSYPGCVSSTDNFFMLNSGLVTMDTTLEVLNANLYDRIPEFPANPHISNFMHVMAVNRLAHTAQDWTTLFARKNGGVPSAQWLVVDYNAFTTGDAIQPDTVRLLEQVPGLTYQADISDMLARQGYWASYNRPFFPETRRAAGHEDAEQRYGALFSFGNGPRASIFKHVAGSIGSMYDMRHVMNRNDFPNEGVAPVEPGHAISARMDLDVHNHLPNGGIDAKVIDRCLMRLLQCQVISGPSHDTQPVFRWQNEDGAENFAGWPHLGMPSVWNFTWAQATPSGLMPQATDEHTCHA